ncbi:MAG: PepSY domain-containing protein, partial [Beijerinckiaceae bacterium]
AANFLSPVHAQTKRQPNATERTRVEHALRSLGFTEWGKIELDDDVWVIEEAIDAEGKEWEIELDAVDLSVLSKEPG